MRYLPAFLFLSLILVACGGTIRDADAVNIGDELYTITFDENTEFDVATFPDENASLTIDTERYIVHQAGNRSSYVWGQGGDSVENAAITVTAESLVEYDNNLYGVMCRVDSEGAGYAFLVSNDGFGAIARTDGRSISFITSWHESDEINSGTANNTIQAICIDNYLALYVNGELVQDAEDDTYTTGGQVGLIGGIFVEGGDDGGEVTIAFDDVMVSAASLN